MGNPSSIGTVPYAKLVVRYREGAQNRIEDEQKIPVVTLDYDKMDQTFRESYRGADGPFTYREFFTDVVQREPPGELTITRGVIGPDQGSEENSLPIARRGAPDTNARKGAAVYPWQSELIVGQKALTPSGRSIVKPAYIKGYSDPAPLIEALKHEVEWEIEPRGQSDVHRRKNDHLIAEAAGRRNSQSERGCTPVEDRTRHLFSSVTLGSGFVRLSIAVLPSQVERHPINKFFPRAQGDLRVTFSSKDFLAARLDRDPEGASTGWGSGRAVAGASRGKNRSRSRACDRDDVSTPTRNGDD